MAFPERDKTEEISASVHFTERDADDAARLLGMIAAARRGEDQQHIRSQQTRTYLRAQPVDREIFHSRASRHMRDRELRRQFFSRAIFGEAAWEMLVVLYISEFTERRLTIGKLAERIGAPLSTTQRWIGYLQRDGLIDKEGHPGDRRLAYVRLLDRGRALLDDYFSRLAE